jgi:cytochrome c peroxidase
MKLTHPENPVPDSRPARAGCAARLIAMAVCTAWAALANSSAQAATASEMISAYTQQAGTAADAARGQALFTRTHGREWSCASCHGARPVQAGQHAVTAKPIAALAPAANAQRFTDPAKVEKWFRRNCGDVLGRECSAGEKADVLGWLITLKP